MPRERIRLAPVDDSDGDALFVDGALRVRDAVAFSGLSRTALYELIQSGELASVRIGKRRLIPKRALVQLLARCLENSTEI